MWFNAPPNWPDSQVFNALVIREEIRSGLTQITGGFDADSARSLAAVRVGGALPLGLTTQSVQIVALHPQFWTTPRVAVAAGAGVVGLVAIAGLVVLGRMRRV